MCWNGEVSAFIAAAGVAATSYAVYRKEPAPIWISLAHFSGMEMLQASAYLVVNQCNLPANQVITLLSYIYLCFQPFIFNSVSLYFIPEKLKNKIQYPVYFLCFIATITMIITVYPFEWAKPCVPGIGLCGKRLCTEFGTWHIAWFVPLKDIFYMGGYSFFIVVYTSSMFVLPLLYGSWRFILYQFLLSPFVLNTLAETPNERGTIWCLMSVGIFFILLTPLRGIFFVKKYPFGIGF